MDNVTSPACGRSGAPLPAWVPDAAQRYLAHTEAGIGIRSLARDAGFHASTVLRQMRRLETQREDPLVDAGLQSLAGAFRRPRVTRFQKGNESMTSFERREPPSAAQEAPDTETLMREALRVLRRLAESGAVLAVAEGMEKAVVVRDRGHESTPPARTAVVDVPVAQAMALKDWIARAAGGASGRIARYRITSEGRAELNRLLARCESSNASGYGFAEAQAGFSGRPARGGSGAGRGARRKMRFSMPESPLTALARRRGTDGEPFLEASLVAAGERLREDFELSQMGPQIAQNWERFLTPGSRGPARSGGAPGPGAARARVAAALEDLGPGLGDVALRCCCYLEGLEETEKRMGWSARSGKVVLRIALQRLRRHYDEAAGPSAMIG